MLISSDRTNFPLIVVEEAGVEVHLLPVTKVQFGQFVDETKIIEPAAYKTMLSLNPAVAPRQLLIEEREQLFISGVLPNEALAFAHWLGQGYDLPTIKEWRDIYAALRREPPPRHTLLTDVVEGAAQIILQKFAEHLHLRSMRDFSLMQGGLVEWARKGKAWVGLGVPRPEFHPNLWDALTHEIKPIHSNQRVPYFGFRLVRRGDYYLADKEEARYVF